MRKSTHRVALILGIYVAAMTTVAAWGLGWDWLAAIALIAAVVVVVVGLTWAMHWAAGGE